MNVIDDPTVGARMGAALRSGIGSGIQALTDWKMSNMLAERETKGLIASGVEPEKASAIARMSPELKAEYYKQQLKMPEKRAFAQLAGQMFGYPTSTSTQQAEQEQIAPKVVGGIQALGALQKPQALAPQTIEDFAKAVMQSPARGFTQPVVAPVIKPTVQSEVRTQPEVPIAAKPAAAVAKVPITVPELLSGKDFITLMQAKQQQEALGLKERGLAEREKYHEKRLGIQEKEAESKIKHREETTGIKKEKMEKEISKEIRDWSEPYRDAAEVSKANIRDYNTMIKLAETGKIRAGAKYQVLSALGIEKLGANALTQLTDKLNARLSQNIQSAFKTGRITNYLEQTFQRSIPSLSNTPEGVIYIAELNKLADQYNIEKNDIKNQFLKTHKGVLPPNADDMIIELAEPKRLELESQAYDIAKEAVAVAQGQYSDELGSPAKYDDGWRKKGPDGTIYIKTGGVTNPQWVVSKPSKAKL